MITNEHGYAQVGAHTKGGGRGVLLHDSSHIIVSGEAVLSAENSGKPLGGRGSAPNPAGEAHSAPQTDMPLSEEIFMIYKFLLEEARIKIIFAKK